MMIMGFGLRGRLGNKVNFVCGIKVDIGNLQPLSIVLGLRHATHNILFNIFYLFIRMPNY